MSVATIAGLLRERAQLGRWNRANSPWVKVGLAVAVIAMSFRLMVSM